MFRKSIAFRITFVMGLVVITGLVTIVLIQNKISHDLFYKTYSKGYIERTTLLVEQMRGGIKWKKEKSIQDAYALFVENEADSPLSAVLVLDDEGSLLTSYQAPVAKDFDLSTLIEDSLIDLNKVDEVQIVLEKSDHIIVFENVYDPKNERVTGFVAMAWSEKAMNDAIRALKINTLYIGLGVTVSLLVVLALLLSRLVISPIKSIRDVMQLLVEGDIKMDIPYVDKQDEVGSMAKALEVFKANEIEKRALEKSTREAEEQAKAEKRLFLQQMANDFDKQVGNIVSMVQDAAAEMQAMSTQLSTSAMDISRSVEETSQSTKSSASAAQTSHERLSNLNDAVEDIDSVINEINGVAERTNLLALNATIEAARAGDAGKGFAVVASEVKDLASQTQIMTDQIYQKIFYIKERTEKASEQVNDILSQVNAVDERTSRVSSAVQEQTAATTQLKSSADRLAEQSVQLKASVDVFLGQVRDAA